VTSQTDIDATASRWLQQVTSTVTNVLERLLCC